MSYPGNPSLAPEVRQRIQETFSHTLDVAEKGHLEEARLGCDFVLRLDPAFAPARTLADRLGGGGQIEVADLRADAGGGAAPAPAVEVGDDTLAADIDLLPELDDLAAQAEEAPPGGGSSLRGDLERLLAERDYEELARRAGEAQAELAADPEAQALLARAQEQMEVAHFVESFLGQARDAHQQGRTDEARSLLDKARTLDQDHPGVRDLEEELAIAEEAATPLEGEPLMPDIGGDEVVDLEDLPELPGIGEEEAPAAVAARPETGGDLDLGGLDESFASLGDLDDLGVSPSNFEPLDLDAGASAAATPAAPADQDPRITELLAEGDAAAARGEHQEAIDAWSRIFLIDIDHAEAARRIEEARGVKAEQEREAEEAYHDALAKVEAGDEEAARADLERALGLVPGHLAAREALQAIDRGEAQSLLATAGGSLEEALDGVPEVPEATEAAPPVARPGRPRPAAAPAVPAPRRRGGRGLFWGVAIAVLLLVAAGAWYLFSERDRVFPNRETTAGPAAPEETPIGRARQLVAEGKSGLAIAQLKRVPPASPYYAEAQALIAEWSPQEDAAAAEVAPDLAAERAELIGEARAAVAERRYLDALPALRTAAAVAPLDADEEALRQQAVDGLRPLESQLELVRAAEYERALRDLWLRREASPGDPTVERLLVTSYYNLGVRSLQQGRPKDALEMLGEAARIDGDDREVQRLVDFAETYDGRNPDMLFRIFVKYLAPREVPG